ncbi:MAG: hypothetical protein M3Y72_05835 [Acidobacteriota bacterium]|nr:hypothetical protein [Acidobacteriota bacterium]
MTNTQLYFGIGIPSLVVLISFINSLIQWWGVKEDVKQIRSEMRELRSEMKDLRLEMNTKLDMILAKLYEHDTEIALLKDQRQRGNQ